MDKKPRRKSAGASAGNVRAVERAIDILQSFTRSAPTRTVAELQRDLGLSRPTLYRLLETLERGGLLQSTGDPLRYTLAASVLRLADTWMSQVDVARLAEPFVNALWNRTDETVALYIPLPDNTRVAIKELRSRQPLSFGRGIGHRDPLTEGASGRALLAFYDEERIEQALRDVPEARRREALRADLSQVRRQGYSLTVGERIAGASAMAAPVFSHDGEVAASLCIFGPEARLRGDFQSVCISLLTEAAGRLSAQLGHQPSMAEQRGRVAS